MPRRVAEPEDNDKGGKPKLPGLTDDNFDYWERKVKHSFYSREWLGIFNASIDADQKARCEEATDKHRKLAWGAITESLNDDMLAKVDNVKLGEVELLLREIRNQFYRATVSTKSSLKDKSILYTILSAN
jgi:hypothetical protein